MSETSEPNEKPNSGSGSGPPPKPPDENGDSWTDNYRDRFGKTWKYVVTSLAAVGAFAVLHLAFDKLGKGPAETRLGPLDYGGVGWALVGMLLFVLGVLAVLSTFVWLANASRASWAYLNRRGAFARIPKKIREIIEAPDSPYIEPFNSLHDLARKYRAAQAQGRSAREESIRRRIRRILEVASIERTRIIGRRASWLALAGTLTLTFGAWLFLVNVNAAEILRADEVTHATQSREDEVRMFPAGSVLPRTPTEAVLAIPTGATGVEAWVRALADSCIIADTSASAAPQTGSQASQPVVYNQVPVTVIQVGTPGNAAIVGGDRSSAVYRIASAESSKCPNVVVGWVPPEWVIAKAADTSPTPKTTSAASGG